MTNRGTAMVGTLSHPEEGTEFRPNSIREHPMGGENGKEGLASPLQQNEAAVPCATTSANTSRLRGYAKTISEATGYTNEKHLAEIEDCMRHDVFHSTLDWQTREQLCKGARVAVEVLIEIGVLPAIDLKAANRIAAEATGEAK